MTEKTHREHTGGLAGCTNRELKRRHRERVEEQGKLTCFYKATGQYCVYTPDE